MANDPFGKPPISGTLYDSTMGQFDQGSIEFKKDGRIRVHQIDSSSPGSRVSWNHGEFEPHLTDQGYPKGHPLRHPFGK